MERAGAEVGLVSEQHGGAKIRPVSVSMLRRRRAEHAEPG